MIQAPKQPKFEEQNCPSITSHFFFFSKNSDVRCLGFSIEPAAERENMRAGKRETSKNGEKWGKALYIFTFFSFFLFQTGKM